MEKAAHLIGFLVPDLVDSHFAEAARGAARILRAGGYLMLISNSESDPAAETEALDLLLACRQAEGLIIASCRPPDDIEILTRLEEHRLPYVLIDRSFPGLEANFVGWDEEALGAAATEHLIARGCRHIAHIRGPENSSGLGRFQGYAAALGRFNLKVCPGYVAAGGTSAASGYQAMRKLLAVNPRLDGVVCYNDAVAVGAIKAILEAGLEVPYDLEVIGAGNLHYSELLRVPLSTVDLRAGWMGEQAAELLIELLRGRPLRPAQKILIPFELIPRESSRAISV